MLKDLLFDDEPDAGGGGEGDLRQDMEILNEGGDETPEVTPEGEESKEEVPGETPEETPEEPSEEGEEKKEEVKEGETEVTTARRPTVREITTKYPNFFKDFPDMRHMLFREQKYTEIFPTIDDATEAADRAESFDHLADLVNSGKREDFTEFLRGVGEENQDSLKSMVANFTPALYSVNRDLYFQMTTPIVESFIRNIYREGVNTGNDNLKNSALHAAQWAFGDTGFATGEKQSQPIKVEEKKIDEEFEREKREFYNERYQSLRSSVDLEAVRKLTVDVRNGLDPNGVFSDVIVDLLVKDIIDKVGDSLEQDEQHMRTMNSIWKRARKAGFSTIWKDRLVTTYLSRARAVMPAIRAQLRDAAFKGQSASNSNKEKLAGKSANRKEVHGQGPTSVERKNGPVDAKKVDWRRTSDVDFLSDRITYRK